MAKIEIIVVTTMGGGLQAVYVSKGLKHIKVIHLDYDSKRERYTGEKLNAEIGIELGLLHKIKIS
jgi:hypothetical protein